ncbi:AraC family transcriptional regulator [Ruminococcus sp. XPD3002]|uniref:helix-turn-helix domain-containing protein n=1 Tax=Ruminococcus sp. XPD3002 TaxID=1452269 RepID=UPI0009162E36|nr:AraC family transcriptional regulator, arabinose operon regulatory protein [Ruminococcus flavefaciens]
MIINNVGFNHCHDADFIIERPEGSGDELLLLIKTEAVFTIDGKDIRAPQDSVFYYPKSRPQFYRCIPQHTFDNDWIHFELDDEERALLHLDIIPAETPIPMDISFLSFCIKSIAYEQYSDHPYKDQSIKSYMTLLFTKIAERVMQNEKYHSGKQYEMLSTIRSKIYAEPFVQRSIGYACHEVNMSRSAFQHAYKKLFGVSFIRDLINSRTEYAKMLLISTDLTSEAISKQCGYRSYVHFARQFKEQTGMSPLEYRKSKR